MSSGTVSLTGSALTKISNGSGSFVTSSSSASTLADVTPSYASISAANLFSKYFTASKATIQGLANTTYTAATINNATGLIWTTGALTFTANTTVGSSLTPTLWIANGNITINAGVTVSVNGLLYLTSSAILAVSSSAGQLNILGSYASESAFNTSGISFTYYPAALGLAANRTIDAKTVYSFIPVVTQEEITEAP